MQISLDTRLGRMLDAGRVTATVTSKRTGSHLTVTIKALAKQERKWEQVDLDQATLIVADADKGGYGSLRIGRIDPNTGALRADQGVSRAYTYAVEAVLDAARSADGVRTETGVDGIDREVHERDQHTVRALDSCGRCGRDLTDPESIKRGIGPECIKKQTKSRSARASALAESAEAAERRMHEMEAAGDLEQTIRDEVAKHGARARMEGRPVDVECDGCDGSGQYRGYGYVENGVFKGATGQCFRCGGKGRQTPEDVRRNAFYDNRVRTVGS